MLSLEKCREILRKESLSDGEIETVRDQLYELAEAALARCSILDLGRESVRARLDPEDSELSERAAIREYDGAMSRPAAELAAVIDFETRKERT